MTERAVHYRRINSANVERRYGANVKEQMMGFVKFVDDNQNISVPESLSRNALCLRDLAERIASATLDGAKRYRFAALFQKLSAEWMNLPVDIALQAKFTRKIAIFNKTLNEAIYESCEDEVTSKLAELLAKLPSGPSMS